MKKHLLLFSILCFLIHINISAQGYTIQDYEVNIAIRQDGSLDISETIDLTFNEQRRGIKRDVPKKIEVNDKMIRIPLSNVKVTDWEYKIISEGNNNVIRIGQVDKYLTGEQSYELSYTVANTLLYEEDHIAFQYNIISGWDTSIDHVSYNIELPSELDIRYNNYQVITGETNANERNASIKKDGNKIFGESLNPLSPGENITVAIKLPVGYIDRPPPPVPFYQKDKFWFIPAVFLAWFINFFRRKSRNELGDIYEVHFPPDGFSPAEVGAYYDNKVNTQDIISLLPYWANYGIIKIMGSEDPEMDDNLYFKKLKELPDNTPEYERVIFDAVFKDEDLVLLSELKNKIYSNTYKSFSKLRKQLKEKELYDEENYRMFHSGKLIWGAILLIVLAVFCFIKSWIISGIMLCITAVTIFIFHFLTPKKSEKGVHILKRLLGLELFLKDGDPDKTAELLRQDPQYFEKLFPYAIAFGLDQSWLKKMASYDIPPPYWYGYHNPTVGRSPNYGNFSKSFDVPKMKSIFTSQPVSSSSGSSGGFSGGSAGGGFGGGGSSW